MKRHAALIPLSRDHHDVLLLAQELKSDHPGYERSAVPKTVPEKIAYVRQVFGSDIAPHFRVEEDVLIRAVLGLDEALDRAAAVIIDDHRRIAALADALRDAESLDALGRALEQHVRREEREFFQLVQDVVPAETLDKLKPGIEAALQERAAG